MANFNKVYLIGNLTRDPELRVTPKGTAICQFGIAVNRKFKDESGALRDDTTFVDIEVVLENFEFLGSGQRDGGSVGGAGGEFDQSAPSPERHSPPPRGATGKPAAVENLDEDVPF